MYTLMDGVKKLSLNVYKYHMPHANFIPTFGILSFEWFSGVTGTFEPEIDSPSVVPLTKRILGQKRLVALT